MSIRADIFASLASKLTELTTASGYPVAVQKTGMFDINALELERDKSPMLIAIDTGAEQLQVADATHHRFTTDVTFRGIVRANEKASIQSLIIDLSATIKQFIHGNKGAGLHPQVLDFQFVESVFMQFDAEKRESADIAVRARIIYWTAVGAF